MAKHSCDVLVIGAGIAGLNAAHALAKAGKHVVVLEARSRIGGRICSLEVCDSGLAVELGAEFVHGQPPELIQLITETRNSAFELDGDDVCLAEGRQKSCVQEQVSEVLNQLPFADDWSFREWIAGREFSTELVKQAIDYVEGFNAADADIVGTAFLAKQQREENAIEGDRLFRLEKGYASLPEYLLQRLVEAQGEIFLSTVAQAIHWKPGFVQVEAQDGASKTVLHFEAEQCIVSVPLGVLQKNEICFDPVPKDRFTAVSHLRMGAVRKIAFVFQERFWSARYPRAGFLLVDNEIPGTWWTPFPDVTPMLTGWIGGPTALDASIATDEALMQKSLATLAKIFDLTTQALESQLQSWHSHNWQTDPYSYGAYSYVPKGAMSSALALAESVDQTLFFAGEHTDVSGHWGTVHGALRSGVRAAQQILEGDSAVYLRKEAS